jgi:hypothetical protein
LAAAPTAFLGPAWKRHVLDGTGCIADNRAYVFAALEGFRAGLKRRDVFVPTGVRYADPRQGLLSGEAWNAARLTVCRSLDRSPDAEAEVGDLAARLDRAWRQVAANLPGNPAARVERRDGRDELVLSPLDKVERPPSLIALQAAISARMPKIDLPDVMLEVAARSGFADAFTHVSERHARVEEFATSLCGALVAQACNIGFEPMVRTDQPALSRNRLSWASQNFIRSETIAAANARIVAAQNALPIAHSWGSGEVASADGLRFVAPSSAVHAGPNPKYFGAGRGITYYNLVSDQFTGLNAIVVPGTLRDSLLILGLLLEQETDLDPTEVMTDTAAYADTVFGLFWLLGYQFSPRLADIGDARFWRIDRTADYGALNGLARHRIDIEFIKRNWEDWPAASATANGVRSERPIARSRRNSSAPSASPSTPLRSGTRPTSRQRSISSPVRDGTSASPTSPGSRRSLSSTSTSSADTPSTCRRPLPRAPSVHSETLIPNRTFALSYDSTPSRSDARASFDVAALAQSLSERSRKRIRGRRSVDGAEETDHRDRLLLRAHGGRPSAHCAGE